MRVSPPTSLKLSADALLRDVRERLAELHPEVEATLDPTHPAWLVLQESAWMVQALSEQLDRYPWAVLQQFAHLIGARLRPAQPSIGVVALQATQSGILSLDDDPARWRFFAPRNENRGLIEFVLAEPDVPVRSGSMHTTCRIVNGELHRAAQPPTSPTVATLGEHVPSAAFRSETFTWTLLASGVERLDALLTEAAERLAKARKVGWLRFDVTSDDRHVRLQATLDVGRAFANGPAVSGGGDLTAAWGTLDDSTWTPPVRVADHPLLPRSMRGSRPLAGQEPGDLLVPDVPPGIATAELLVRDAQPAPAELIDAIWSTLVHIETRLGPLRPTAVRGVEAQPDEPKWIDSALRGHAWRTLVDRANLSIVQVELVPDVEGPAPRVAWIDPGARQRVFALVNHQVEATPLPTRRVWEQNFPDAQGVNHRVVVDSVDVPSDATGLLLVTDGTAHGALFNPALVVNAPVVRDGRRVTLQRAVPEPVHLLYKDIVTREVLEALARRGLHPSTAATLARLPVAVVTTPSEALVDFEGTAVDPTDGLVVLNAPDEDGRIATLRRGERVQVAWYRRTDAETANLPPNSLRLVEQAPTTRPDLASVAHPLGTHFGLERESQEAAVQRVFGPTVPTPITPGDWERLIKAELGPRGEGLLVRVWGYSERSLMSTAIWPPAHVGDEATSTALAGALPTAGPETLLVAVGPQTGSLSAADLSWADAVVTGLVNTWSNRVPMITNALVTPLWPLRCTSPLTTPAYNLRGLKGTLSDAKGRRCSPPAATLLLNAVIVEGADGA